MNISVCPACGGLEHSMLGLKSGFSISKCLNCNHWWARGVDALHEAGNTAFLNQYCNCNPDLIDNEYDRLSAGEAPGDHVHTTNKLLREMLKELQWNGASHLDVGCGSGFILAQSKNLGVEVQGVEPASWATQAAKRWQIPVEKAFLRRRHFDREFDLVTATDVIEHQADPVNFLQLLASNTSADGLVGISFPYNCSFNAKILRLRWHMIFPPTHCQFFSYQSIRALANRCHLQIVATRQHNTGGFPILSRSRLFQVFYTLLLDRIGWGDQLIVLLRGRP